MITIRQMTREDKPPVLSMMRTFYTSPAVHTDGSEEIFLRDIENCTGNNPFVEGYILETEGIAAGYAMVAKSYSTEFGKPCIWIEDLYIKPAFRGRGIGTSFFSFVKDLYPGHTIRLEAEPDNAGAIDMYRRNGFGTLPYLQLIIK